MRSKYIALQSRKNCIQFPFQVEELCNWVYINVIAWIASVPLSLHPTTHPSLGVCACFFYLGGVGPMPQFHVHVARQLFRGAYFLWFATLFAHTECRSTIRLIRTIFISMHALRVIVQENVRFDVCTQLTGTADIAYGHAFQYVLMIMTLLYPESIPRMTI